MKERLQKKLRAFLIGMSFPVLFSSGCSKIEERAMIISSIHKNVVNVDRLRDDLFSSFSQYFTSNDLEYTGLESLLTDEEIADVIECSKTTSKCDFVWDGDIEKVKGAVRTNSSEFLKEHEGFSSAFCEVSGNDFDLFQCQIWFETAFDQVIDDLVANSSGDISEDICKFQTLSIVFGEIEGNLSTMGFYQDNTNTIVLCYKSIMEVCEYTGESFSAFLTRVLSHELNHTRQIICEDRLQKGQQYKEICCKTDDISLVTEASAESAFYNVNDGSLNKDYFIYSYERKYEALLFLFAVCNENAEVEDYYNSIFDTDLEKFYEFLGCDSEEDIYSFYKILGSMDAALGRNSDLDSSFETIGDTKRFIGYNYKVNLFHHILSDMIDYTCNHSDFSLEENLALFKIVRTVLCDSSYTVNEESERIYDPAFVTSFKVSEDMYYSFLSIYYQTSISQMEQLEETYVNEMMDRISRLSVTGDDTSYQPGDTLFLERFPLLEPVFRATDVMAYDYDFFVENNDTIYAKKK